MRSIVHEQSSFGFVFDPKGLMQNLTFEDWPQVLRAERRAKRGSGDSALRQSEYELQWSP